MRKTIRTAATVILLLPACALAQQDLSFSMAVDLNYKRLKMEQVQNTGSPVLGIITNTYTPTMWTLNLSPSLAWRGVFLTVGWERSLGESSTSDYQSNGVSWTDRRYSREENNITLGYNVWAGLSLFVGYLDNTTNVSFTNYSVGTAGVVSYGKTSYNERGPYYGLGYSHRFGGGGSLAASYAYLKGRGTFETSQPASALFPSLLFEGDVKGSGFGLSWSAPLAGSLYYRLGYKGNRYTFDFTDQNGNPRTTKQSYDSFFLGIANYF